MALDLEDSRFEVTVVLFFQELLLAELVYAQNISDSSHQSTSDLPKSSRNMLARSFVKQMKTDAVFSNGVSMDFGLLALAMQVGLYPDSQEEVDSARHANRRRNVH